MLILVTWVLPAEFNQDPLGTGAFLGLTKLATQPDVASHHPQRSAFSTDQASFELSPFASVEYKYKMTQGQTLVYQWQATDELVFDLHSEAEGTNPEDAVSFAVGRADAGNGSYTAPYNGIHGWFWENRTTETVSVTLTIAGFIDGAILYENGFEHHKALGLATTISPPITADDDG